MVSAFADLTPERAEELADELRRLAAAVRNANARRQ
jgi:DNA-directed RNA polymerase subunit F